MAWPDRTLLNQLAVIGEEEGQCQGLSDSVQGYVSQDRDVNSLLGRLATAPSCVSLGNLKGKLTDQESALAGAFKSISPARVRSQATELKRCFMLGRRELTAELISLDSRQDLSIAEFFSLSEKLVAAVDAIQNEQLTEVDSSNFEVAMIVGLSLLLILIVIGVSFTINRKPQPAEIAP